LVLQSTLLLSPNGMKRINVALSVAKQLIQHLLAQFANVTSVERRIILVLTPQS